MTRLARLFLFAWLALSAHALPSERTGVTREDGSQWAWGYDDRGEVTSGGKKFSDGTSHPQLQFGYQYDALGNRTQSSAAGRSASYSPNSRNQYDSHTVPPYLSVTGEAAADANVAVQAQPALRKGTAFSKEWSVNNATAPVRENVRIAAAKPAPCMSNVESKPFSLHPAKRQPTALEPELGIVRASRTTRRCSATPAADDSYRSLTRP